MKELERRSSTKVKEKIKKTSAMEYKKKSGIYPQECKNKIYIRIPAESSLLWLFKGKCAIDKIKKS
jgi:hypothetical protein